MNPQVFLAILPLTAAISLPSLAKRVDTWGGSVSLGPTKSHIANAVTTIVPGTAPSTQNGELFLWPGMSNGTGDLIQTTLESWPDNSWCGATGGTVTNAQTGAELSTYTKASGPVNGYGTGTECDDDCTGTVAAQQYLNTVITLDAADTTFGDTIATAQGATYLGLTNEQGGKVWKIASIKIPSTS
ncbi:MAG: hypothetical protein MMC23_006681 [Stictis urceolatum]|nr:hypothetical protein [Stictis urceolata]